MITAIAPWFGGKRNLAPEIVRVIGEHRVYWEPFCGSLAVLFAKQPCTMETVNDLHGDIINLARVIQYEDTAVTLFGRLSRTLMHEDIFHECASRMRGRGDAPAPEQPDLDRAYDYFVASWLGRNGVAGTKSYNYSFCARYTRNGGHAARRFISAVESIPSWFDRLRNVSILNRDAFELLDRIRDDPGTAIYCDPPYLAKGTSYAHDFESWDHYRLAKALSRFVHSRVVVSYYDHPRLADLYPPDRWSYVRIEVTKALVNQGMRDSGGAVRATEVLITNTAAAAQEAT